MVVGKMLAERGAIKRRRRGETADPTTGCVKRTARKKRSSAARVTVSCVRESAIGRASPRTAEVGFHFGIPLDGGKVSIVEKTTVPLSPGSIVLLLGPSGSGKSSALAEMERRVAGGCVVNRITFPVGAAVVDRVASGQPLAKAVSIMTACGFAEPHLWVRRFRELSDGEKFRAQLARAISLQSRSGAVGPLLCDEFCSALHRRVAKAISFNLRKIASQSRLVVVVACSHEDLIRDLQPDTIVRFKGKGQCDVATDQSKHCKTLSFHRRLCVQPGRKKDYDAFAAMHYRATDELGFVDKVFLLRDGSQGDPLGILVYAHSPLQLSLRNQATNKRFSRNPKAVNRDLRILRRLVIHPDVRGCGLGHWFVRKTLPLVGTKYVECLAAMGEFNPVFEKAGMERIGQYGIPPKRQAALEELTALDVDPFRHDFFMHVSRRKRVRAVVARVVFDWYRATTGGGESRVERQSPHTLAQTFRGLIGSKPVYYLWRR